MIRCTGHSEISDSERSGRQPNFLFGGFLSRLNPKTPVNLIGYSYGSRIITGGLTLAGGSLDGYMLSHSIDTLNSWLSVHVFAEVAAQLSTVDGASLKTFMDKQSAFETGLTMPLDFTKAGPVEGVPRMVNHWVRTGEIDFKTLDFIDNSPDFIDAAKQLYG